MDGVIIAEETANTQTTIEKVAGIRIDNGLGMTQAMNNEEKQSLELSDVPVVLTSNTLTTLEPISKVLQSVVSTGATSIVLICRAITETVIQEIKASTKNGVYIYPINAPYVDQREVMLDLEAILGGRFLDAESAPIDTLQLSDIGRARNVDCRRYDGVLTGFDDDKTKERVAERIKKIEEKRNGSVSDFEKKNLEARIAQLTNDFALMKVGAVSEGERKRIFDKVEDAVNATRAAFQEGTVPGAGLAFKDISEKMDAKSFLKKPILAIWNEIKKSAPSDFVVEDWVRDPVKVLRIVLEQACITATDLATVNVISALKKEKYNAYIKSNVDSNE